MPTPLLAANLGMLFTELPLEHRFEAAAIAGFRAVEHGNPYALPAPRYRQLLDNAGLHQVLINSSVGPPDSPGTLGWGCLPNAVKEFRTSVKQALEYATVLDCSLVHLRSGIPPSGTSPETALALFVDNTHWAAEQAASAGIRFTIEALNFHDAPGYLIDTQEQAAAVVAAVGPEYVGIQFDIYHCQRTQGDITTRLKALHDMIAHIQIADAPSRTEPGTGEICFEHVFACLEELGYRGWIGCEYHPLTTTVEGLTWRDDLCGRKA